jgi:hypothetical protein
MFSEQDVDRELEAALTVSPSPDFEARVLQRVAADRPSQWRAPYGWLAAAASVVLVAGAFYALNRPSPADAPLPLSQVVDQRPRAPVVGPVREPSVTEPARPQAPGAQRQTPRSAARTAGTAARASEPEVIVPLNQMEAVRRLVRAVNDGLVEPPAEPLQGPMAPPAKLAVTPLVVEPIPVTPVAPGAETPAPFIRSLQ